MRAPRAGELAAFAGAVAIAVSLALRWYEAPGRSLDAWQTFGAAVVLLMLAALGALALMLAALTERSPAVPVTVGLLATVLGVAGVVGAIVRALERPDGATGLCAGAWLALAGALLVLAGAWQSMRDERPGRYPPANVDPRTPPAA